MLAWLIVTFALLLWAIVYCAAKIVGDFRGPRPATGVWGLFALAGILSALGLMLTGVGVAISGV